MLFKSADKSQGNDAHLTIFMTKNPEKGDICTSGQSNPDRLLMDPQTRDKQVLICHIRLPLKSHKVNPVKLILIH
jgi:hypothetical protein